ncbi:MAG: glutamine--fructose-6-phosphate transaminase (isomerizing) [Candidatus Rokubacteria bacterium]|nr:glutamine--fructose-6-phosphate transaminase (isomerizing) [Candidatus Rokubacteria bacterium]
MCGIIGYVGNREAVPILMDGLKRLEYRGYDSAGVGVICEGRLDVRRSVGKIAALERVLSREPLRGRLGVAHTRWATHGRPSDANAHPHRDCSKSLAVVHNGIIENCASLRKSLEADGHQFESQTDTEVIAHLIERYAGEGLEAATRRAAATLRGAFALGIIGEHAPGTLVGVRNGGAPLVVAVGGDGLFLASDIAAVLKYTRDVFVLDDGEMAVLSEAGARIVTLEGRSVHKPMTTIPWSAAAAEKDGYPHFMLKEIHEQPRTIEATIRSLRDPDGGLGLDCTDLEKIDRIALVACGTSWHAALVGKYMVETLCRIPVEVDIASEFRYREPVATGSTLTVAISQSGETADTLGALRHARGCGSKSVAICNVVGSSISREADGVIYTRVGPEISVASTKSFTGQLVALYLFAVHLGRTKGALSADQASALLGEVMEIPHLAKAVLGRGGRVVELAPALTPYPSFLYLGRGVTYPVALEGALKLKELAYTHAEGYPAGEMKHGPIALVDPKLPVVVLAPRGRLYEKALGNIEEVKARNGLVVAVASDGDDQIATRADHVLYVPRTTELLTPILCAIPLQLLAYHIAVLRECDVDQPRNLAKSVTVE